MIFYFIVTIILMLWERNSNEHFFKHLALMSTLLLSFLLVESDSAYVIAPLLIIALIFMIRYMLDISIVRMVILDRRHGRKTKLLTGVQNGHVWFLKYQLHIYRFCYLCLFISGACYLAE